MQAAARGPGGVFDRKHRRTTAGLVVLISFIAFEAMAVGTAMPTAVADLSGLAWYGWPFTAFLVASVVGLVVGGDVGDRRGPRAAMVTGALVFAAGLLVAGLAGSMAWFVAGRAVQGLAAGLIIVAVYVVAGQAYAPALRPRLFGAFAAGWVLPALVGPVVAGLAAEHLGWRPVFLALVPLVVGGLALVLPALRALPPRAAGQGGVAGDPRQRRWAWALLAGLGVAALQYAGQRLDLPAVGLAAAGGAALVTALRRLLPAGTAAFRPGLPAVVASRGLLAGAFFGMDALLPLALTAVHGYSPVAAGVPLTAGAIGWVTASQLQARRPTVSRVRLLRLGFTLLAAGLAGTALVTVPELGGWPAYATWAVAGLGMGLAMPSVGVLLLEQSPDHRRGADSAALQIADVTTSALSVGFGGICVAAATAGVLALPAALGVAVAACTLLAAAGALLAGRAGAPLPRPASSAGAATLAR